MPASNVNKGPGSRLKKAKEKGKAAATAGESRDSNPYNPARPGMVSAWYKGFDSAVDGAPEAVTQIDPKQAALPATAFAGDCLSESFQG